MEQHDFVPLPDTPDQCARTGCGSFWNNYVAHHPYIDSSGRPAKPPITPNTSGMPSTPELDKMQNVKAESQPAGAFLEWLVGEKGYVLAQHQEGWPLPWPVSTPIEELLAEHFEIDLKKVEEERRAILDYIHSRRSTSDHN